MKTIEVNLYKFSELSEEAKEKAFSNWAYNHEYFWGDDAIKSIEKFCKHFNCSFSRYSIDWMEGYRNEYFIDIPYYMEEVSGDELKSLIESMGSYDPDTLRGLGDCKFTGYCMDEEAADGARMAFFKGKRDLREILDAGVNSWYSACNKDYEWQNSMEYYSEHCEANDYDFTEDGDLY